jgi:hypothetical protein
MARACLGDAYCRVIDQQQAQRDRQQIEEAIVAGKAITI